MKKLKLILITLCVLQVNTIALAQRSFADKAAKIWFAGLGSDFNKYKIYTYPTNNFGVGTTCAPKWVPKGVMLSDMITSYGLDNVKTNSQQWRNVNGYAYFGLGGAVVLNDSVSNAFGINLLVPKLLNILSIKLGANYKNSKSVKLTIDSAIVRFLNFDKYINYVESQPQNSKFYKAYKNSKLQVVTSDLVILGYKLIISPKDSLGLLLNVKLDSLAKLKALNLKNDSLSFNFNRSSEGNFVITSPRPLVLGILVQKQSSLTMDSEEHSFKQWDFVKPEELKDKEDDN